MATTQGQRRLYANTGPIGNAARSAARRASLAVPPKPGPKLPPPKDAGGIDQSQAQNAATAATATQSEMDAVSGGGGGGGAGGGGPYLDEGADLSGMDAQIAESLRRGLSGEDAPFTDEMVRTLNQRALKTAKGQARANTEGLRDDLIARGLLRSGIYARGAEGIRSSAMSDYSSQAQDIRMQQITKNYEARMAGLDRAQNWVNAKRQYLLGKESNRIQYEVGMAQVGAAYARIAAEKEALNMQMEFEREQANRLVDIESPAELPASFNNTLFNIDTRANQSSGPFQRAFEGLRGRAERAGQLWQSRQPMTTRQVRAWTLPLAGLPMPPRGANTSR